MTSPAPRDLRSVAAALWLLSACVPTARRDDASTDRAATEDASGADTPDAPLAPDVPDVAEAEVAPDVAPPPDVAFPPDAAPPPDVAPPPDAAVSCASLPLCDDFEAAPVGGAPVSPRWSVVSPNCSGSGRVAIDGAVAHSGSRSVRVNGGGGYCDHVFLADGAVTPTLGMVVYGRVFVRFSDALGDGHVTFLTLRDAADTNRDLRMGGQSRIFMWNRESDDATLPELSPAGIARSVRPTPLRWHCVEFRVDQGAGTLQTWIDGAAVDGLTVDSTPTMDLDARWLSRPAWRPRVIDWKLGWESYAGQSMTLWFDDAALARERIGCGG